MSDLIERLGNIKAFPTFTYAPNECRVVIDEAADEIERLQARVDAIKAVVDKVSQVSGKPCGCKERRDALNRAYPYKNK